jgi:uncharacterized membrane protein
MITPFLRTLQLLTFGVSAMKTIASLAKTTAIGGLIFLLPLVLLVAIVGKAFNIIRVVSTPLGNLISAEKVAGYAVADLLALTVLLVVTLLAGLLARSPVFDRFYKKIDAIMLQVFPGYSYIKGMTGSLSDAEAEQSFKSVAVIQDDTVQIGYEVERLADGWVAVYLPSAPDTRSGSVAYFTDDRIVPLDTDFCLKTLGRGSSEIISDTARLQRNVQF